MKKLKYITFLILVLIQYIHASAQLTQTIRGTVIDPLLQTPVAGATVVIAGTGMNTLADSLGNFRFRNVPVGTHTLQVSHIGYKEVVFGNIVVNTGKEVVLTLSIERVIRTEKEVVVTAGSKKNRPLNDMSVVSARAFTVEETQKYAAAMNDPLRMVTGFAGVATVDDNGNDIVIRGNSPTGLLWRMEGVDIPNPNHFSNAGSSGGGISILSAQLLSNSDFITGAFAPEYGNALSGVFDLRLRKGNNERKEYTVEAGLLGLNIAAEGPFSSSYKGSYLVNYRYSTLSILNSVGFKITEGITTFQDLSYNIYLPTKKLGSFTLFGFGGLSSDNDNIETDPSKWRSNRDRYGDRFKANTAASGLTHTLSLNSKATLKSAVSYSYVDNISDEAYVHDDRSISTSYKENYKTTKWTATSTLNYRLNNKNAIRTGIIVNLIGFGYKTSDKDSTNGPLKERINTTANTQTLQAFAQWQFKPLNNLAFTAGMHYLSLQANNTSSIEPRASIKWDVDRKNSLAFGYGLHSQIQALGVYYGHIESPGGITNKDVGLTKSHHWVLSYSRLLGKSFRFKAEVYYQHLFNVPVSVGLNNTFSTLNMQDGFVTQPLVNKGKGRNYGIELTLEKNLNDYFYYIINSSIYQAKYTASDGIERNSRFNGNYLFNSVAGKEFPSADKRRIFGINIKVIYGGGYRYTPIDISRSRQTGNNVPNAKEAFTLQLPAYFRPDLRISMKWNRKKLTSTLSLDIQNFANRKNVLSEFYDYRSNTTFTDYQNGLIPVLNYKVEF